jgi:hypothetical protein
MQIASLEAKLIVSPIPEVAETRRFAPTCRHARGRP